MAKVRIHVQGSPPIEIEASEGDERYYDELPFTSGNVLCTEIHD